MSKFEPIRGGCLCRAVRYEVSEPLYDPHYCHCRTCQKTTAAPVFAGAYLSREAFRLTEGKPNFYRSSPVAERGFCAVCGTYLVYRPLVPEWHDWLIISIASLDHPEHLSPECHYGIESQLGWLNIRDDLPRERYEEDFIEILSDESRAEREALIGRFGSR